MDVASLSGGPDGILRCLAGDPEVPPHHAAARRRTPMAWTLSSSGTGVPGSDPSVPCPAGPYRHLIVSPPLVAASTPSGSCSHGAQGPQALHPHKRRTAKRQIRT